ncbi:MAG: hypothetical protein ACJ71T_02215 [Actinomycetales bacterium]
MSQAEEALSARARRAQELAVAAAAAGLPLGVLGGAAVEILSPSARPGGRWSRSLADIDVATVAKRRRAVEELIVSQRFSADKQFNMMNGSMRLRFFDEDSSHLDVFVDEMRLCHPIMWGSSLHPGATTLPVALLLLSKLQIVQIEEKDRGDLSALLTDQWKAIGAVDGQLGSILRKDWGLLHTASLNLEKLVSSEDELVALRAAELLKRWAGLRPSIKARLRGAVGERMRWYEEPEEV